MISKLANSSLKITTITFALCTGTYAKNINLYINQTSQQSTEIIEKLPKIKGPVIGIKIGEKDASGILIGNKIYTVKHTFEYEKINPETLSIEKAYYTEKEGGLFINTLEYSGYKVIHIPGLDLTIIILPPENITTNNLTINPENLNSDEYIVKSNFGERKIGKFIKEENGLYVFEPGKSKKNPVKYGDSGSGVINPNTGEVIGIIHGINPKGGTPAVYVLPLKN